MNGCTFPENLENSEKNKEQYGHVQKKMVGFAPLSHRITDIARICPRSQTFPIESV